MTINLPYKKMKKVNKFGFVAKCDCGNEQRFRGTDFDLSKSNGTTAQFNNIYICPECGETFDGIFENIKDRNAWYRNISPIGSLIALVIVCVLIFGGYKLLSAMFYTPPATTDINKATNRELNDFYKWDHEQQQQKYDNQPAFNNN